MKSLIADTLATMPQMFVGAGVLMHYIQARKPRRYIALFVLLSTAVYFFTGYTQMLGLRAALNIAIQLP